MIYLIPKCFKKKKEFIENCFKYLDSISELNIEFNPHKCIYPRIKNSKKRGKNALIEILMTIGPSYFSDEHHKMNELINTLKWGLKKTQYNGVQVLTITSLNADLFKDQYFPTREWSHISENDTDLLNIKTTILGNHLFEDTNENVNIKSVDIIKSHIDNYVISDSEKLELIKYLILN
tara:strand:- start:1539 stop:2072 length:534 start_codon:yes stop_codon:yes gene_type:complete